VGTFFCPTVEIDQDWRDSKKRANPMSDIINGERPHKADVTNFSFDKAVKFCEILCLCKIIRYALQAFNDLSERGPRQPPLVGVPLSTR